MTPLETSWYSLSNHYGATPTIQSGCWQELAALYGSPGRYYHTLGHIQSLLRLWDKYQALVTQPEMVAWAIWYHDAIYDPTHTDNETQSAVLAQQRLTELKVPTGMIADVVTCIQATKYHTLTATDPVDAAFLLDIDLSILGSPPAIYQRYAEAIRQEYHMLSDEEYQVGRSLVLAHFLALPTIYHMGVFREQWEAQARLNLAQEYGR